MLYKTVFVVFVFLIIIVLAFYAETQNDTQVTYTFVSSILLYLFACIYFRQRNLTSQPIPDTLI